MSVLRQVGIRLACVVRHVHVCVTRSVWFIRGRPSTSLIYQQTGGYAKKRRALAT